MNSISEYTQITVRQRQISSYLVLLLTYQSIQSENMLFVAQSKICLWILQNVYKTDVLQENLKK